MTAFYVCGDGEPFDSRWWVVVVQASTLCMWLAANHRLPLCKQWEAKKRPSPFSHRCYTHTHDLDTDTRHKAEKEKGTACNLRRKWRFDIGVRFVQAAVFWAERFGGNNFWELAVGEGVNFSSALMSGARVFVVSFCASSCYFGILRIDG